MFVRFTTDFVIIQLSTSKCQLFFSFFCFIFTIFHSIPLNRQAPEKESFRFFSSDRPHNLYHSTFSHKSERSPDYSEDLSDYILHRGYVLYNSLSLHCVYNFFKSGNVSTYNVVALEAVFLSCIRHIMANINHDIFQLAVNFFKCPAQTLTVL